MHFLLQLLKNILGKGLTKRIRPLGHGMKSFFSAVYFGFPAKNMTVIGITGTKGKTSTTVITGRLLNMLNIRTGYVSTSVINLTGKLEDEFLNPFKMSTIDGFVLQKYLNEMVNNGCQNVVLETSSQGLEQNRHWGIGKFDITTFLNLYPEHIEAHGSLENYLAAKGKLFESVAKNGFFITTSQEDQKSSVDFMWSKVPSKLKPTIKRVDVPKGIEIQEIENTGGIFKTLKVGQSIIKTKLIADFEIVNLRFASEIAQVCKYLTEYDLAKAIYSLYTDVPGRMEFVVQDGVSVYQKNTDGLPKNLDSIDKVLPISILVDYAHEPESNKQLLENLWKWKKEGFYTQVIHILSSDGAGRDDWKKPIMGKTSYDLADFTILTTDNYDSQDNPYDIVDLLSQKLPKAFELKLESTGISSNFPESDFSQSRGSLGSFNHQKLHLEDFSLKDKKFLKEIDRRIAFLSALYIAKQFIKSEENIVGKKPKVLIVSTGVGSEQGLTQPKGKLHWDERVSWLEEWLEFEVLNKV